MSYYAVVKVILFVINGKALIGIVKHKSNSQMQVERRAVQKFLLFHPVLLSFLLQ